jgi:hypothetical protein
MINACGCSGSGVVGTAGDGAEKEEEEEDEEEEKQRGGRKAARHFSYSLRKSVKLKVF